MWIRTASGDQVPGIIEAMSIMPEAMMAVRSMGKAVSFGASALTRMQEELIATAVSVANKCRY